MTTSTKRRNIVAGHRITWWVWAWNSDGASAKMRHTSTMMGTWGWDATCECGWETSTGGATKGYVKKEVWFHKWQAHNGTL